MVRELIQRRIEEAGLELEEFVLRNRMKRTRKQVDTKSKPKFLYAPSEFVFGDKRFA